MNEKIKEILDRFNKGHDELTVEEYILLENYITNLQQLYENGLKVNQNSHKYITELEMNNAILKEDLDKANDIIKKDRQFYKCRMDEYAELKKENEDFKTIIKQYVDIVLHDRKIIDNYESRCEGTVNLIDRTIEIIKQQPTKDDSWILSRLYGFKYALNGSDEK